jgi:galactokinase
MEMLEAVRDKLSDVEYRRAKHCVGEDIRTLAAVEALKRGDYASVGEGVSEWCALVV